MILRVSLFGAFDVRYGEQPLTGLGAHKLQELLCFLVLHRDRPHPREVLASLLWGGHPTSQSKRYLRKALWQLQAVLGSQSDPTVHSPLLVDRVCVQFDPTADLWLDVALFEQAWHSVRGLTAKELDSRHIRDLRAAVDLYRGDLLEGWYEDWCVYKREWLQNMYLAMLGKLMAYCEMHHQYEAGTAYGERILRHDRAHERTHRRLMRLSYLSGDRTAAIRQYQRCVAALREELGVKPSKRTVALYDHIRADRPGGMMPAEAKGPV
jgi:DNA-binding SARP family transcriptional activator